MNDRPESSGSTSTPVFVEDLFLTDVFLIKGRLSHKPRRLSNLLEEHARSFLQVVEATMVSLRSREVIRTPSLMVNTREILLAHELVDFAGDAVQRRLAAGDRKTTRVRAFYNGPVQFELAGRIEPGAYETSATQSRKYFIMEEPQFRGLDLAHPDLALLASLDYAIVRRDRMAYVYDFG